MLPPPVRAQCQAGEECARIVGARGGVAGAVEGADGVVVGARHGIRVDVDAGAREGAGEEMAIGQHEHAAGVEEDGPPADPCGHWSRVNPVIGRA